MLDAAVHEGGGGQCGAVAGPPLLEVQLLPVRHHDVGLDLLVGDRDETHAEVPAACDAVGRLRERQPVAQHARAGQVGADVEVAEGEPRPADPVGA